MILTTPITADLNLATTTCSRTTEFQNIYELYWLKIFGLAYHRLHSTHLSENVVQDVFTSLWIRQSNPENAPIRNIYAWLTAATKYAIIKELVDEKKRPVESLSDEHEVSTAITVDFIFIEKMLAAEINRLPKKCKVIYRYSREGNLPNKEIARQLNLSEKTVEKHITNAIRKLRVRLGDFFPN